MWMFIHRRLTDLGPGAALNRFQSEYYKTSFCFLCRNTICSNMQENVQAQPQTAFWLACTALSWPLADGEVAPWSITRTSLVMRGCDARCTYWTDRLTDRYTESGAQPGAFTAFYSRWHLLHRHNTVLDIRTENCSVTFSSLNLPVDGTCTPHQCSNRWNFWHLSVRDAYRAFSDRRG